MSEQTSAASPRTERTVGRFFVCGGLKSPDELLSPFQGLQTARLHHYRLRIIIGGGGHTACLAFTIAPSGLGWLPLCATARNEAVQLYSSIAGIEIAR